MSPPSTGRPTVCFIDLDALRWNFRRVRAMVAPGIRILPMVKANAYGHGAVTVARTLEAQGADALGVATLEEALELREAGIRSPILVLAGTYPAQAGDLLAHGLTPVVYNADGLRDLERAVAGLGATLGVHVKVDTGMGRIGFLPSEIDSWLPELNKLKALKIEGLLSHFSRAESVEGDYTLRQLEAFRNVAHRLRAAGIAPPLIHIANSAATITLPEAHFDMVRPGLILYGVYPAASMANRIAVKPVLSWKTRILQLKKVPAGSSISYGQTFVTRRESLIATLPIGYADGYPRLLSNRGAVLVKGKRAPVVGRVCMDLTMIEVTDIPEVQPGDEVVLLGRQGEAEITADEIAAWSDTISYEILTSIGARVPRIPA
ncbi:MAG TPA: alanine racemase [candidate division Zixibacteria bacterium]|nr:alanine racemase [candidate division Zixibacteria bacterium]